MRKKEWKAIDCGANESYSLCMMTFFFLYHCFFFTFWLYKCLEPINQSATRSIRPGKWSCICDKISHEDATQLCLGMQKMMHASPSWITLYCARYPLPDDVSSDVGLKRNLLFIYLIENKWTYGVINARLCYKKECELQIH